jgi:hypothetical protein
MLSTPSLLGSGRDLRRHSVKAEREIHSDNVQIVIGNSRKMKKKKVI